MASFSAGMAVDVMKVWLRIVGVIGLLCALALFPIVRVGVPHMYESRRVLREESGTQNVTDAARTRLEAAIDADAMRAERAAVTARKKLTIPLGVLALISCICLCLSWGRAVPAVQGRE